MFFEPCAVDKSFGYLNDDETKNNFAFTYKTKFKLQLSIYASSLDSVHELTPKDQFSQERTKITPLNQKSKDRLAVTGLLALEAFFVFGAVSNFYGYIVLKIYIDLYLAVFSTILTVILLAFLIVILISYLDKRKVLKSFQNKQN